MCSQYTVCMYETSQWNPFELSMPANSKIKCFKNYYFMLSSKLNPKSIMCKDQKKSLETSQVTTKKG
jgi:hypothetical protein